MFPDKITAEELTERIGCPKWQVYGFLAVCTELGLCRVERKQAAGEGSGSGRPAKMYSLDERVVRLIEEGKATRP